MLVGQLEIQMMANMARLSEDMHKAQRMVGSSMGNISHSVTQAKSVLASLGIGLSVGYFVHLIKGSIDAADQLAELSQKAGISIESLAGWKLAAEQSGTSLESVAKGVKGLSGFMVDHADKLKKLGITATASSGAMIQFADVFSRLPDGITKTKLALDVFGKSGMDMIPMLNLGSQGLADAQEKAAEYGRRMKELAPDADKFNDQLSELSMQASIAGISLGTLVAGPMAQWLEANNKGIRIAGSMNESLRLFVFNLDAMTSEKPVEEIKRLTKALEDYQAASAVGKFMQSPTGFLFGGRESDLQKQIKMLEFLKQQEERAAQPPKAAQDRTPLQAAAERDLEKQVRAILGEDKPAKTKKQNLFDPEGNFWFAVEEAAMKNQKYRNEKYLEDLGKAEEEFRKAESEKQKNIEEAWLASREKLADIAAEIAAAQEKEAKRGQEAWGRFTENVQRNLGDVLYNGLSGKFQDIGDLFKQMLLRMAADAAAARLTQALFGDVTAAGNVSGLAGQLMGLFSGGSGATGMAGFSAAQLSGPIMSYDVGTDYVPHDMVAKIHQGERIVPAAQNNGSGSRYGGTVVHLTYAPTTYVDSRTDQVQVRQIADAAARKGAAELVDRLERQGRI